MAAEGVALAETVGTLGVRAKWEALAEQAAGSDGKAVVAATEVAARSAVLAASTVVLVDQEALVACMVESVELRAMAADWAEATPAAGMVGQQCPQTPRSRPSQPPYREHPQ